MIFLYPILDRILLEVGQFRKSTD